MVSRRPFLPSHLSEGVRSGGGLVRYQGKSQAISVCISGTRSSRCGCRRLRPQLGQVGVSIPVPSVEPDPQGSRPPPTLSGASHSSHPEVDQPTVVPSGSAALQQPLGHSSSKAVPTGRGEHYLQLLKTLPAPPLLVFLRGIYAEMFSSPVADILVRAVRPSSSHQYSSS